MRGFLVGVVAVSSGSMLQHLQKRLIAIFSIALEMDLIGSTLRACVQL